MKRLLCSLTVALAAAAPAVAAAGVRIAHVDTTGYPVVRVTVVTSQPSLNAPLLRENGTPVAGLEASNLGRCANIVLAIDRSRSMIGRPLADAAAAARSFVAAKPHCTRIEIVALASRAVELTGLSSATIDADQALRTIGVDAQEGTALWGAVALAASALEGQASGGRALILLTDGGNTNRDVSLVQAIAAARKAGVAVYPIGIESPQFTPAPLQRLALETGGSYHAASSTAILTGVYASIARELERTWRLSYPTSARPGEAPTLDASVAGLGGAQQRFGLPSGLGPAAENAPTSVIPSVAYSSGVGTLVLMLVVGLATACAVGLMLTSTGGRRLRRRIEPHVGGPRAKRKAAARSRFDKADNLLDATEKVLSRFSLFPKLQHLLDRADLPLRAVELFYLCVGVAFVPSLLFAAAGAPSLLLVLTMATGGSVPVLFVWFKARKRAADIDAGLPDLLITMAASLKAGHSFRQGVQASVDEGKGPITKELKRVLTETSLGRPMDQALQEMAVRVGSKDLAFVITAVTIQGQVGGSLAGIFDLVGDTIRQRQQFARKIKALTAMGRMSAYTLMGLPFFLAIAITLLNPEFMHPLYHTNTGHQLIIGGLVMMAMGSLILKKIVSFKG